jgi:hypothetical protein
VLIVTALVCLGYASTAKSGNLEHQNADRAKPCKAERTPAKLAEKVPEVGVGETFVHRDASGESRWKRLWEIS